MIDKRVVSCLSLKYKSNQDCNTRESVPLQMCWTLQFLPKNALLVVTINPFYRTPAFIARLVPVKHFTVHLSHVINSVIQVIHSNWSHIFGVKYDNLQVNKKAYETFYEIFDNLVLYWLYIPTKAQNLKYCSYYLIQFVCSKTSKTRTK